MTPDPFSFPNAGNMTVLDTPLLRVSRPVAACSRCRSAKVKCDGKLPACTACEKSNRAHECSSTNDQFARGKERSYVATLESRVERLEKKIMEAKARRSSSINMLDWDPATTPRQSLTNGGQLPKTRSNRAARKKELFNIDSLVSDFGYLAVNATARDFYGFTTSMSYARLILSASSKESMDRETAIALPPRYAATPLLQHYMNTVYVLIPIVEEASFYASVDAVYHSDSQKASPFDHWTVRMVLAIASISLSEQLGDAHYKDAVGHVRAALEYAEEVLHPGLIASIQATVLLVQYATYDPQHFDSWSLLGAASRAMVDIGMHQDPHKSAGVPKNKIELRRRVYHCIYCLDRSTSLVQTRSFSFSDDSAQVAMPFSSSSAPPSASGSPKPFMGQQSFDSALDLIRLRQIQSSWYTTLFQSGREPWSDPYPYIWRMYHRMTDWFNKIVPSTPPSTKAYFEIELLYSYVYILSPGPRCPRTSDYAQRLMFEHCISYATNMVALLNTPPNSVKLPPTSYDALRAYMAGRQLIDVLSNNQDEILSPNPPLPPPTSSPTNLQESIDPFASPISEVAPPTFPIPLMTPPSDANRPTDPVSKAITAINDFVTILTRLGVRYGYINWRDRFQQESAMLLNQLHQRATMSSSSRPPQPQHEITHDYRMWSTPSPSMPQGPPLSAPGQVYHLNTSQAGLGSEPLVTQSYGSSSYTARTPVREWNTPPQGPMLPSNQRLASPHRPYSDPTAPPGS